MVEAFGGAASVDATIREVPMEIINIANQGTLTSNAACASATVGTLTNKKGTSITACIVSTFVSAGTHQLTGRDTLYIEALSSSTLKVVSYATGHSSDTQTIATGSTMVLASAINPSLQITASAGVTFVTGDTAVIDILPVHAGDEKIVFGIEKVEVSTKYVSIIGQAQNQSNEDILEFKLHKCALTGAGAPLNYGDYMQLTIHADAMVDDSLSTQAAGEYRFIQGA